MKYKLSFLDAWADKFTPEIKRAPCPDENSGLCLQVRFESETDLAHLKQIFDYDQLNFEGYFANRPDVKVFASSPSLKDTTLHVSTLVSQINEYARLKKFWSFSSLLALFYYIELAGRTLLFSTLLV